MSELVVPSDRRALQSVAVQFFANGWVYATFVPRLPEIRDRVGISVGALGVVLMLGSVAGLLGSFLTGRVIGRLGTRRVLIIGGLLSVGSLPLIGIATAPAVLVVGLAGVLFFDVFIDVAMNVQGSVLSARRHRPVMHRLHGLWSLGTVVGGAVTIVAAGAGVSVPVHLTLTAAGLLVVLGFVARGLLPVDEPHEVPTSPAAPVSTRRRWLPTVLLGLGGAAAMTLEVTPGDWAAFRLSDDLGAGARVTVAGFVAFTAGMTIGRFGGDSVVVRLGRARMARLAATLSGGGLAVAALVPQQAVVVAAFAVAGLGTSVLFPELYDAAARAPGPPGSGFTAMLVGQRSAALLTPLAVGALADTAAFGVGEAMVVVAVPWAVLVVASTFVPDSWSARQPSKAEVRTSNRS